MTQLRKVKIAGTGSFAPEKIVTNDDIGKMVETNDDWIFSRTGIRERRIAEPATGTSQLALPAAQRALDAAGVEAKDLDLIVVATITPDTIFPSTACRLQQMLGAQKAGAMDLSAACTGFLYALSTGWQFIRTGMYDKVLVVGAEIMSTLLDWEDRNSCILFGDGAGAAVLVPSTGDSQVINASLHAQGDDQVMVVPAGGSLMPVTQKVIDARDNFMHLKGREIYKFAVSTMVAQVREVMDKAGIPLEEVDMIVPHQVNKRIINSAMDKLGLPAEKCFTNIHRYGNTSAASIPVALDEAVRGGHIKRGDLVVFVAFGAGLTWGSLLFRW